MTPKQLLQSLKQHGTLLAIKPNSGKHYLYRPNHSSLDSIEMVSAETFAFVKDNPELRRKVRQTRFIPYGQYLYHVDHVSAKVR